MEDIVQAYSYVRLSSRKQLKGLGLERQMRDTREAAKRHGWYLSEETFSDLGVSGWKGKNIEMGALRDFLDAVESGVVAKGSVLIVENVDRLSRAGINTAVSLMLNLLQAGISIYTTHTSSLFVPESKEPLMDLMKYALEAERAHKESEWKSERVFNTKQAKKADARKGLIKHTAMSPHWLKLSKDRKEFLVIDSKASIIREIFERYAAGTGTPTLCRQLAEEGKMASSGKPWHPSSMRKLLRNRTVLGELQLEFDNHRAKGNDGEPVKGYYPAIVSEELWASVQARLGTGGTLKGRKCTSNYNVLAGLLRCRCGSAIHMNTTKYKVKTSTKYSRRLRCGLYGVSCKYKGHMYTPIAKQALNLISTVPMIELTDNHKRIGTLKSLREQLNISREQVRQKRTEIDKLTDAIAVMDFSEALIERLKVSEREYKEAFAVVSDLENQIADLENTLRGVDDAGKGGPERFRKLLSVMSEDNEDEQSRVELNLILRRYVDHVLIDGNSLEVYNHEGKCVASQRVSRKVELNL